ncbi:MAG: hypothetical protein V4683_14690 [Bacteroidota bacterium]
MRNRYLLSALAVAALFCACQKDVNLTPVRSGDANQILVTSISASGAKPVKTVDPVKISVTGSTEHRIDIKVTAGKPSGAPSGFSIQWTTLVQLAAYTGPVDNTGWPLDPIAFCNASFSGDVLNSRYALKKGESVTLSMGNLLLDDGASTTCTGSLPCGTAFVFRAFAHESSPLLRSPWSATLSAATIVGNCGTDGL